jgi:hypothetical protein
MIITALKLNVDTRNESLRRLGGEDKGVKNKLFINVEFKKTYMSQYWEGIGTLP